MTGTILDIVNGGSIYLLVVDTGEGIVDQPVEHRCMWGMVEGEGVTQPGELVGREVEVAEDGMSVEFV
jgi:hypothetical protein